ncbi:PDZ and LIM domain protein 7 [Paragonimus heterotremus]|uniref:PDZ and LIM domain protein 7 n=1 Tax=Paragonimus heterotremus TaxID=100268 RepID=A0A8J4T202_9TREM|nr:PDZ and LIM domain protein 7 [Paragonimus heterotremus]
MRVRAACCMPLPGRKPVSVEKDTVCSDHSGDTHQSVCFRMSDKDSVNEDEDVEVNGENRSECETKETENCTVEIAEETPVLPGEKSQPEDETVGEEKDNFHNKQDPEEGDKLEDDQEDVYVVVLGEEDEKDKKEKEIAEECTTKQENILNYEADQQTSLESGTASAENKQVSQENTQLALSGVGQLGNIAEENSPVCHEPPVSIESRVVLNTVTSMNSHVAKNELTMKFATISMNDQPIIAAYSQNMQQRANLPQRSIYHRNLPVTRVNIPSWYTPPEKTIVNIGPPPPAYQYPEPPVMARAYSLEQHQRESVSSPTRKLSASTPYVGSHVIATETGPSITVLLRRPTSERQWGFTFYGGAEYGCPPFVNKVSKNSIAYQNGLEIGDVIVSICKQLTVGMTQERLKAEILRAGNDLDLVLIRRGVDLEKLSKIVPQALQTAVRSPTPGSSMANPDFAAAEGTRGRSAQSLTRGRSFRSVKTKSLRILEEQLAAGETPSSVLTSKQHFQGARGLSVGGSASSFSNAYGQAANAGYGGHQTFIQPITAVPVNASWSTTNVTQPRSPTFVQPNYGLHQAGQPTNGGGIPYDQTVNRDNAPGWDSRSEQSTYWTSQTNFDAQPHGISYLSNTNYPCQTYTNPHHQPDNGYVASTTMTVPIRGNQPWSNQQF